MNKPEPEQQYKILCILESSSSEQFVIVNGGEVIQIIHGLIGLLIVNISLFSPNSFLDANSNNALWKPPDLGQCQVVVHSVSDLEDIIVTNGKPFSELTLDTQACRNSSPN